MGDCHDPSAAARKRRGPPVWMTVCGGGQGASVETPVPAMGEPAGEVIGMV